MKNKKSMKKDLKSKPKTTVPRYLPYCPKCHLWIDTWKDPRKVLNFCEGCGTELIKESECKICGLAIDGQWKFCRNCGVEIVR
jgi:hypothetical protein